MPAVEDAAEVVQRGVKIGAVAGAFEGAVYRVVDSGQFPSGGDLVVDERAAAGVAGGDGSFIGDAVEIKVGLKQAAFVGLADNGLIDLVQTPGLHLIIGTPFPAFKNRVGPNFIAALRSAAENDGMFAGFPVAGVPGRPRIKRFVDRVNAQVGRGVVPHRRCREHARAKVKLRPDIPPAVAGGDEVFLADRRAQKTAPTALQLPPAICQRTGGRDGVSGGGRPENHGVGASPEEHGGDKNGSGNDSTSQMHNLLILRHQHSL